MYRHLKRLLPFFILILIMLIVYFTDFYHQFTLENLRHKQVALKAFVGKHPILSPLIFVGFYIVSVCLIIPDSTILMLFSGLVFPLPLALLYCVFSETVGAIIFFTIFRTAFGDDFFRKEKPFFNKMRKKFRDHSPSYLLFLRFSHIFPFWLINVIAAYFKVTYTTFIWTTIVGVLPLTYLLVEAGHNLSNLFAKNVHLSLADIFNTEIKILLFIVGLLALAPIAIKKLIQHWKK